ncbi:MAG: barstar family protein [Mycobacterium sp.]
MSESIAFEEWMVDEGPATPALGVAIGPAVEVRNLTWKSSGRVAKYLQAPYMRDSALAFHEFGAAFQYPYGTGLNWNALDDWIRDEYWFGAAEEYLIVVYQADVLLAEDPDGFSIFVESASGFWADYWRLEAEPKVRFRVLFHVEHAAASLLASRLEHVNAVWQGVDFPRSRPA